MRWDLIGHFETLRPHELGVAEREFTGGEDFFAEHLPGAPRLPEPLLIELVAQTGGVLYGAGLDFSREVILAKVEATDFPSPVVPPCRLRVTARLEDEREEATWVTGEVTCEGRTVARVRLFLVTFERLGQGSGIVFNERFMDRYKIRELLSAGGRHA
ncbi:MAG: hypothetical protein MOGMAGMI_02179 [Candidatus Omnitrophica bacterium]|nr:hypothetical protein [Candidatus Omnitrophota bacterium]